MPTQTVIAQVYIGALRSLGYQFKVNDLDDTVEVNGEQINDLIEAKIRSQMRDKGFGGMDAMLDAIKTEALKNRYHPVRDYLNSLKYDGGHHISDLTGHFCDKHNIFPTWIRHWLIGAIAKVISQEQNPMLVLDGRQDIGKSYFARWLIPPSLRSKYFIEQEINPEDKDTYARLTNIWIWEVGELQATTRKADREALKQIITQSTVRVRKPYDKYDTVKPAISSFIGTVNNDTGLLNDPTGSRRFLICRLTGIDWTYSTIINVDDVWAEAYAAFLAGEDWKLSEEEIKTRNSINEDYQMLDPVEEMIGKLYDIDPKDHASYIYCSEILRELESRGITGSQRLNMMAISSVMTKYGCERKRIGSENRTAYLGITLKPNANVI